MSNVTVVVGGQYGSEAKGHVTAQVVKEELEAGAEVYNVRVAGPNAGHTVYDEAGNKFALRQVPVGAALSRPGKTVHPIIAAGSEIDLPVLIHELDQLTAAGHRPHLWVDGSATLIREEHKRRETTAMLTAKVGSTGKGIGAARAARLMREAPRVIDDQHAVDALRACGVAIVHTDTMLRHRLHRHATSVVIEGTQGFGLGLHGKHYPQTTSSDCRAIDFLGMAGISPWQAGVEMLDIFVVARCFPIRVAGNSGPMFGETTWQALNLPEERTTVTQKVRRVGAWDSELVRHAVWANGGGNTEGANQPNARVQVALTMVDQRIPELEGKSKLNQLGYNSERALKELVADVSADAEAPVTLVTTSPRTAIWL